MTWSLAGTTLVIPAKADSERDAVAAAWRDAGGAVERLDRFWEPPPLDPQRVRLYGADTFCLVVAQQLGLELLAPPDDFVREVPGELLRRRIVMTDLGAALVGPFPCFVKPVVPKQFRASVWHDAAALRRETNGLADDTPVLAAEVVTLDAEARTFVLDGAPVATAIYEGAGDVAEAAAIAARVARLPRLPRTCVIDTCLVRGSGWAFLEANATWGAGLNGCDPTRVLGCIDAATVVPR